MPAKTDKGRGELLSWMFFVSSGVGPYSGQSVHFRNYAPEKNEYAINRYAFEAQRHFGILDARLAKSKYLLGDSYTIVDMNVWGWSRLIPNVIGEKTGKFMPAKSDKARGELFSWMMFVASGVGPYSGQSVHFRAYAPEKIEYAINRYAFEAQRHFGIINERLGKNKYMLGDTYTIVDMNVWGWARLIPNVLGEKGWEKFPNLKRLSDEISARPAAAKAIALKDKHTFKTEMDDEAKYAMFPHLKVKVA